MRRHALAALLATAAALYKVDIHIAGRAPSPKSWEAAAVDEYAKRLRGQIDVKTTWHKSGDQLEKSIAKMDSVICLSPEGKRVDSEGFSTLVPQELPKHLSPNHSTLLRQTKVPQLLASNSKTLKGAAPSW